MAGWAGANGPAWKGTWAAEKEKKKKRESGLGWKREREKKRRDGLAGLKRRGEKGRLFHFLKDSNTFNLNSNSYEFKFKLNNRQ